MSESDVIYADQVEPHAVVYLVEDCDEGPRRSVWCERAERDGRPVFVGGVLAEAVTALRLPDDGRRVECLVANVVTPPPSRWKTGRWLILDTETTGLDNASIVELGAVVMEEGRVLEHRCALFNPGKPIDPRASAVHHITDAQVRGRPRIGDRDPRTGRTPAEGLDALAAKYDVQAIVGYNFISFDLPILRRELGERWQMLEDAIGLIVDPLVIVRLESVGHFWKGQGRHRLTAVADKLKLSAAEEPGMKAQAHRAAWDCVLAGRILWRLRAHIPDDAAEAHAFCQTNGAKQRAELDAYWAARNGSTR